MNIRKILEPFILDEPNHLYCHNVEHLIKVLEKKLNNYTETVIKKSLEIAVEKVKIDSNFGLLDEIDIITSDFKKVSSKINKQSIIETFPIILKEFKI